MKIIFDVITLFPEIFEAYFHASILKRAQEKKLISLKTHNLRDAAEDKRNSVDDKPYGGGAGMLLMPEPILKTVDRLLARRGTARGKTKIVIFSAKGKQFNQKIAADWAKKYRRILLITGRYEGIDERVKKALHHAFPRAGVQEISIGPYVLNDGDVAAMAVISAVARLVPDVIRKESLQEESHAKPKNGRMVSADLLEYPQYTRPESFTHKGKTYRVPKILLSGDHKRITDWKKRHQKRAP